MNGSSASRATGTASSAANECAWGRTATSGSAGQQLFDGAGRAAASGDNAVAMPVEVWQQAFMQNASAEIQALVHSLLMPQPMQYFTESVDAFDAGGAGVAQALLSA